MHRNGLILMCLAYPAVAVLAGLVWYALPDAAPWLRTSSAAFAGTGLLWLIGLLRRSPSVYDAFWPVAPMLVAAAWALDHASAGACVDLGCDGIEHRVAGCVGQSDGACHGVTSVSESS